MEKRKHANSGTYSYVLGNWLLTTDYWLFSTFKYICIQIAQKNCCIAGKAFAVKALKRMNGYSTFYNLFGSGVSCLRIKRLRDLEIEFLICEILSTYVNSRSEATP